MTITHQYVQFNWCIHIQYLLFSMVVTAYVAQIDGTQELPGINFGSTDSTTGEWEIKTTITYSVAYGNNGFLILKNGNSLTDESSNSNNFTLGGGTLTKTEDCPSNVFATLNPLTYQAAFRVILVMVHML